MAKKVRSKSTPPKKQVRKRRRLPLFRLPDFSRFTETQEFRPDTVKGSFLKPLRFTQLQRLQLLRWVSYIAVCILCLVVQDVIMSRVSLFGATTDLAAGVILLITVLEGSEVGSVFVLLASMFYYFSGSSPGAYTVVLLTTLGILASLFRQQVWHRSSGSIILCTGLAVMLYEIGVYGAGIFLGLTRWGRLFSFLFTGVFTALCLIPLYHVLFRIGQIGGYVWKE